MYQCCLALWRVHKFLWPTWTYAFATPQSLFLIRPKNFKSLANIVKLSISLYRTYSYSFYCKPKAKFLNRCELRGQPIDRYVFYFILKCWQYFEQNKDYRLTFTQKLFCPSAQSDQGHQPRQALLTKHAL